MVNHRHNPDPRRDVVLYGHLRKRFGRRFRLVADTPAEALDALIRQVPGFREHLEAHSLPGYRILVGDSPRDEQTFVASAPGLDPIRIVPVVAGAKDEFVQILVGAALIYLSAGAAWGASAFMTGAQAAVSGIGWAMAIGGVSQALASQPGVNVDTPSGKEGLPSYVFGQPTVTIGQGRPVPVLLGGPLRIGGAIVSSGVTVEAYQPKGFGGLAPDDNGTMGGDGDAVPFSWSIKPQG